MTLLLPSKLAYKAKWQYTVTVTNFQDPEFFKQKEYLIC